MATRRPCRIALAAAALVLSGGAAAAPSRGVPEAPSQERAAPPAGPAQGAGAPAGPHVVAVEHVFRAAEELDEPLRRADAAARGDPAVEAVERTLADAAAEVERLRPDLDVRRLEDASAREIARLRQAIAHEDRDVATAQLTLDTRSDVLAAATRDVQDRLASWQATGAAARREQAPPAVLRRIAQAEDDLRALEARLRAQRDRLLALQGRVSDLRAELARASAAVEGADAALQRRLFEVESAPLWRALAAAPRAGSLGAQLRQALHESGRDVAAFVAEEQGRIGIHLVVVLAIAAGLVAVRRPIRALAVDDPALDAASRVASRPGSAALLLSLVVAGGLYPEPPPTVRDLLLLAFLLPLLRLLPGLLPDRFRRPLWALAALVAADRFASLAPPRTLLARVAVLAVAALALGAFARGLRLGGWARAVPGGWGSATRVAAWLGIGLLAVAIVSNVVGNASLSEQLAHATVASISLAVGLTGVVAVLEGALAGLLHLAVLQRRPIVARHRTVLLRRTAALLRIGAVALWASRTARVLGIGGVAADALGAVLALRVKVGGLDVSLGNVAAFGITLALGLALARLVRFVLDEGVFAEFTALPRGFSAAVSTTVQYAIVVLGFSWAVLASGMEMSRFSVLVGALGVGIGFGLQNVVNNFVSGLILLYERPVQVRDIVEVAGVAGEVTRIGVRSSTVRTFAGAEVIVPNATLISAEVTNWTLSDRRRRIELALGVAYGTDPRRVLELLLAAVTGRAGVLQDPAPVALFLRFGESALEFALRFWTADFDTWQVLASDVMIEVHASLGRAGITIPFPQRDLHVRSIDAIAVEALAGASTTAASDPEAARRAKAAKASP